MEEELAEFAVRARQTKTPEALVQDAASQHLGPEREHLALERELVAIKYHVADLEQRMSELAPLLRGVSFLKTTARFAAGILIFAWRCLALLGRWPATLQQIKDARFRSERLTFDPARGEWTKRLDRRVLWGNLGRASGLFHPPLYKVRTRQRLALAHRPRVLHAIANVWVGGSTQLIVDLHDYLGHRIEMEVLTSSLPPQGRHEGMTVRLAPQPASRDVVRTVFSRFRPHIVHVHYWGSVDEPWYRVVFEIAAEFQCPVVQNVNTPVAPFRDAPVACNVFVSQNVLDRFGSEVSARIVHPGVDLERFAPAAAAHAGAYDAIGMIYRLETDKLSADAIELFIATVKRRPATRVIIIGHGSLFSHFRRRVEREGLAQHFEFTGYVPYAELPERLARFKIFVAPVRQESFGQVVPFAMSAGLAVAGYRVGALPEILGTTETLGQTLDETVDIIAALLDDPARIKTLGERNHAIARDCFSVETMAAAYSDVYRDIAPRNFDLAPGLPAATCFPL